MTKFSGAEWLTYYRDDLSEFGKLVADILGQAFRGLYHQQSAVANKKVDWSSDRWIEIVFYGTLSTYDDDGLTLLVLLCHRYGVRLEISGASSRYLRLCFSPRKVGDTGPFYARHLTIEQQIERLEPIVGSLAKAEAAA
ncbi:MAG: hypothetical protein KME45_02990 [Stenomitos rutilans HA7619-LM2]|nr:hypothetical protein [Stenomitos rutilans HA7619-LM2]MBW4469350.1 hypothetical protein [Stenomitos rutilans HA7619-LM2]